MRNPPEEQPMRKGGFSLHEGMPIVINTNRPSFCEKVREMPELTGRLENSVCTVIWISLEYN